MSDTIKLDYSISSPADRVKLVEQIIAETPPQKLTNKYLQILANYIIFAMTKEEKKSRKINTENRLVTINKRETSLEGLMTKFESGEDGFYNLVIESDKNIILSPKISITQEDLAELPQLRDLHQAIDLVSQAESRTTGRRRYLLKKQLIEMYQDQYVIKTSLKQPIVCMSAIKNFHSIAFDDNIQVQNGVITDRSLVSLMNYKHISALLCNYSRLKADCYNKLDSDGYYMMESLDELIEQALNIYPLYYDLMILKIDGCSNTQIQQQLDQKYHIKHSLEYISSLWRNKIPKLIAEQAKKNYLDWYYTIQERGTWKKCSRCGQIKLAHNLFFSKNTSSKDGFYSICKQCRNAKKTKGDKPKIIKRIPYKKIEDKEGEF